VPGYINTLYPMLKSKVRNIDCAPGSITVMVKAHDELYSNNKLRIDLLPLLKIVRTIPEFSCLFTHFMAGPISHVYDRKRKKDRAD
jgi:hypothetical protein